MITVTLIGTLFAFMAVINWILIRWTLYMIRRERQISVERTQLVNFLNRNVHSLTTSAQPEVWLGSMTQELAKTMGAQGIWVYFQDEGGNLLLADSAGPLAAPETLDEKSPYRKSARMLEQLNRGQIDPGDGVVGEVFMDGRSRLLTDIEERGGGGGVSSQRIDSLLAVPIRMNIQVIGVICVINKPSADDRSFTFDDQFLLEALSSQVALGRTLTQIMDSLSYQQRLEQELNMASRIQHSLLPGQAPQQPDFTLYAHYQPALEVGGDYYDFIDIDENLLLVVVADASGKGIPACMLMAMCRTFLRSNAARFKENLEGLMAELNANIFQDTDGSQYVTLACCLIDRRDHTVEYVRAGHTELLIREANGEIQVIQPDGPGLGLLPSGPLFDVHFDTFSFSWQPGSSIMMFTDGITEARDEDEVQYGLDNLITLWGGLDPDPKTAALGICDGVQVYAGSQPQADDQTIVIMTRD